MWAITTLATTITNNKITTIKNLMLRKFMQHRKYSHTKIEGYHHQVPVIVIHVFYIDKKIFLKMEKNLNMKKAIVLVHDML